MKRNPNSEEVSIFNIAKVYDKGGARPVSAIHNISFSFVRGEIVCILGRSGCGKTTLLKIIAGFIQPDEGEVTIFGEKASLNNISATYIQQTPQLLPYRSVLANAALGLELRDALIPDSVSRILNMLELFGLKDFISHVPSELSGGMQQRVALVRALALDSPLVLCDEPFSSLDYENRLEMEGYFWRHCKGEGRASLFVTHQIDSVIAIADKIVILSPRPASVFEVIKMDFEFSNMPPSERRESKIFSEYYSYVWNIMRDAIGLKRE